MELPPLDFARRPWKELSRVIIVLFLMNFFFLNQIFIYKFRTYDTYSNIKFIFVVASFFAFNTVNVFSMFILTKLNPQLNNQWKEFFLLLPALHDIFNYLLFLALLFYRSRTAAEPRGFLAAFFMLLLFIGVPMFISGAFLGFFAFEMNMRWSYTFERLLKTTVIVSYIVSLTFTLGALIAHQIRFFVLAAAVLATSLFSLRFILQRAAP